MIDDIVGFLACSFLVVMGLIVGFFIVCLPFAFIAESEYKATFLNNKFGTNYTTADMFWKGGAIMEMNAYQIPEKPKTITIKEG